jgi:hypothetical protein
MDLIIAHRGALRPRQARMGLVWGQARSAKLNKQRSIPLIWRNSSECCN